MRTQPTAGYHLCVQLSAADKTRLKEKAIKHEVSVSELVRKLIREDGK